MPFFRARGFAGVSISDITAASGLTVGSIYKVYSDKEGNCDAALTHYIAQRDASNQAALAQRPNARNKLDDLIDIYLSLSSGENGKLDCMVMSGVADIDLLGSTSDRLQGLQVLGKTNDHFDREALKAAPLRTFE